MKPGEDAVLVLPEALDEVAGDADVEGAVGGAGEDVDGGLEVAHGGRVNLSDADRSDTLRREAVEFVIPAKAGTQGFPKEKRPGGPLLQRFGSPPPRG